MHYQENPISMFQTQGNATQTNQVADHAGLVSASSFCRVPEEQSQLPSAFVPTDTDGHEAKGRSPVLGAKEVENRKDVFIAGRGGITNHHPGNKAFRTRVAKHADKYHRLKPCERGRAYARTLLKESFTDVTFVVAHSYFFKNLDTISKEKTESVEQEHGGSLDALERLPSDRYFTVGEAWVLGIISDIVRFEAAKRRGWRGDKKASKKRTAASDEDLATPRCVPPNKCPRKRHSMAKGNPFRMSPTPSTGITLAKAATQSARAAASRTTACGQYPCDRPEDFESLIKWPLLTIEDEPFGFDQPLWGDEAVLDVLRELGS